MKHEHPQVSIIIPCYNYASYLPRAVNSILSQTGNGFRTEIIIVDDGSTDNTAEMANSFGNAVRYVRQENQGLSAARNTGMRNASGDFLVFLDADDELGPDTLSAQLASFNSQPDIDISVCCCICAGESNANPRFWSLAARQHDLHLCKGNISPVHAFMLRTEKVRPIGYFDRALPSHEDYDFWLRCASKGLAFEVNPATFVIYRQHEESMSSRLCQHWTSEAAVRARARALLEMKQDFPGAGKYSGWLAYAAGQIDAACRLKGYSEAQAETVARDAVDAAMSAANLSSRADISNASAAIEDAYFAAGFLLRARTLWPIPGLDKAAGFLAKRYPRLAALSNEGLQNRFYKLRAEVCVDTRPLIPALKALEAEAG